MPVLGGNHPEQLTPSASTPVGADATCPVCLQHACMREPLPPLAAAAAVLAVHGIVNTVSTKLLAWIATFSAGWHFCGSLTLVVLLACVAPTHQDASYVFLDFQGVGQAGSAAALPIWVCSSRCRHACAMCIRETEGWCSVWGGCADLQRHHQQRLHLPRGHAHGAVHVRPCSLLPMLAQPEGSQGAERLVGKQRCWRRVWCRFTGYDACGHMSEETQSADRYAAWGIVLAIGCSSAVGFLYVLSMMFSIQVATHWRHHPVLLAVVC